jgi:nicotinamide mononucleotide transporter
MAALIGATTLLAACMAWSGKATWLEAASFITGAACVWLTVKESLWNFPISLLNVATFSYVYFNSRLFADATLQIVYFVLTAIGWYLWLHGGQRRTALHIVRASALEIACVLLSIVLMTIAFWQNLRFINGSASFWDALTTAISLGAQWLLNRKRLENWIAWIVVDVIYIPLYLYKELYLTSLLYAVFLVMASIGLSQWRARWLRQTAAKKLSPLAEESIA